MVVKGFGTPPPPPPEQRTEFAATAVGRLGGRRLVYSARASVGRWRGSDPAAEDRVRSRRRRSLGGVTGTPANDNVSPRLPVLSFGRAAPDKKMSSLSLASPS